MNFFQWIGNLIAGVKETIEDVKSFIENLRNDTYLTEIFAKLGGKDVRQSITIIVDYLKGKINTLNNELATLKKDYAEAMQTIKKHTENIAALNKQLKVEKDTADLHLNASLEKEKEILALKDRIAELDVEAQNADPAMPEPFQSKDKKKKK